MKDTKKVTIATEEGNRDVDVMDEVEIHPFGTFYVTPCPMSSGHTSISVTEPRTGMLVAYAWDKEIAIERARDTLAANGLAAFNAQVAKRLAEATA